MFTCVIFVNATVFQEDGRLNLVFRVEKAKFLNIPRFRKAFATTDIQPVFMNRPNLKKLIVRTKLV